MAKLSVTPDIERGGALRDFTAIGHLRRWPERASREMAGSGEAARTTPPYNFVMAIYPRIFAALYDLSFHRGERAGMAERRRRLLATAQGRVLEIGAGTGLNLPYYTDAVSELVLTEPEAPMARRLARRAGGREVVSARAEALPFADASFDAVLSTFGVMFAPDQARAASELARVCRPGGRIGLANWTPQSLVGQMFKALGRALPPPPGVSPPTMWGDETHLLSLFGEHAAAITATPRVFNFRYRSAAHFVDVFRTWYGPVHKVFAGLPTDMSMALENDLTDLLNRMNQAGTGSLVVPGEYLEIVIARR
jgi:ubiquinone/menaquinone biosynthesis C-methylase UbiE